MRKLLVNISLLAGVLLLVSCGNEDKNSQQQAQAQQAKPFPVITVPTETVTGYNSYPTSIEGVVNSQVRAKVQGYIQEVLVDEKSINQETYVAEKEELEKRKSMLGSALSLLSDRERKIFSYRRLTDDPKTLEELSKEYNVSRERIRQIEVKAFEKVQAAVKSISKSENNLAIEDKKLI